MEELIRRISESLGISQEAARKAVIMTTDYLRTKLPQSVYSDVEIALETTDVTEEQIRELGLFRIP